LAFYFHILSTMHGQNHIKRKFVVHIAFELTVAKESKYSALGWRTLFVVCFLLGNSPGSEFYMPTFRNALSGPASHASRCEEWTTFGSKIAWANWLRVFSSQTFFRINTPTFWNLIILHTYPPMIMEQSVLKRRHIKFKRREISRKKSYNFQNTAKVWNQEDIKAIKTSYTIYYKTEQKVLKLVPTYLRYFCLNFMGKICVLKTTRIGRKMWGQIWYCFTIFFLYLVPFAIYCDKYVQIRIDQKAQGQNLH
jgi:hypothetical protein